MRLIISLVGLLALFSPLSVLACTATDCAAGNYCATDARISGGSACYRECRSASGGTGGCTGTDRCVSVTGHEVCVPSSSPLATGSGTTLPSCATGRTCPVDHTYVCISSACHLIDGQVCTEDAQCKSGSACTTATTGTGKVCTVSSTPVSGGTATTETPFVAIVPKLGVQIPGVTLSPSTKDGEIVAVPYLAEYVNGVYRYMVGIVLIIAIVMVVYGGFRYLVGSSLGDVKTGKTIIIDALAGMLLVLGAYMILDTVNPATLDLSVLKLSFVAGVSDYDMESLESELLAPEPAAAAGASTGGGFVTVDVASFQRLDTPCFHLNTPADPSMIGPLTRAGEIFCRLRGTNTSWRRIVGGAYRPAGLSLSFWLKRCLNRVTCIVATGSPLPAAMTIHGPDGRWTFADPTLANMVRNLPQQDTRVYSDAQIQPFVDRLGSLAGTNSYNGHGRGLAADIWCDGASNGQFGMFAPCQLILEQAMKEAGFCRIPNEWWHFELASNHPTRACNAGWAIGTATIPVGQTRETRAIDYRSCPGNYNFNAARQGANCP
ncbi:MAG: hypothetical protein WCK01_02995 [Candidatus Uhrbacteria bacterium]